MSRLDRLEGELKEEKIMRQQFFDKISKLETQLNSLLKNKFDLKKRIEQLESGSRYLKAPANPSKNVLAAAGTAKAFVGRSCQDLKSNDNTLQSGNYMIDPDGDEEGDPAFEVYCDMIGAGYFFVFKINSSFIQKVY